VQIRRIRRGPLACFLLILAGVFALCAQQAHAGLAVPVRTTVTASVAAGISMPQVGKRDVVERQRRNTLPLLRREPARGVTAGPDLFVLIDDGASRHGQIPHWITDEQRRDISAA
jgi:hypothetical protein